MGKIIIDLTETQPRRNVKFHGGGRYGQDFYMELVSLSNKEIIPVYLSDLELPERIITTFRNSNIHPKALNNVEEYRDIVKDNDANDTTFIFPLSNLLEKLDRHGIKIEKSRKIVTLHGLRLLELLKDKYEPFFSPTLPIYLAKVAKQVIPEKILYKRAHAYYERIIKHINEGDVLLTDSHFSKNSLIINYPHLLKEESVKVIYPRIPQETPSKGFAIPEKYILLQNTNRYEKNILRVLNAIERYNLLDHIEGLKIILIGVDPKTEKKLNKRYHRISDSIISYDFLQSWSDLHFLEKNASCFVYPSINEGFGLPPLQAMLFGTPVLLSAATSLSEVGLDGAFYINPKDELDIAAKLRLVLTNEKFRENLIESGYERVKKIEKEIENHWDWLKTL